MSQEDCKTKVLFNIRACLRRDTKIMREGPGCDYTDLEPELWKLTSGLTTTNKFQRWIIVYIRDKYAAIRAAYTEDGGTRVDNEDGVPVTFHLMTVEQFYDIMRTIISQEAAKIRRDEAYQHRHLDGLKRLTYKFYEDEAPPLSPTAITKKPRRRPWGFKQQPLYIVKQQDRIAFTNRASTTDSARNKMLEKVLTIPFRDLLPASAPNDARSGKLRPDMFDWNILVALTQEHWQSEDDNDGDEAMDIRLQYRPGDDTSTEVVDSQEAMEQAFGEMLKHAAMGNIDMALYLP